MTAPTAPTLTAANDNTGTSLTATITPPAEYDTIRVYYRLVGATEWTSAGTYTGEAGVAGTKQITGLTAAKTYEVVAVSDHDSYYSIPAGPVRVKVLSSSKPVNERIMDDLVADLSTITVANGYHQTVSTDAVVRHRPLSPDDCNQFPTLFVWEEHQASDHRRILSHTVKTMVVVVGAWTGHADDPEDALAKVLGDIETVLAVDRQRSSLALDTFLVGTEQEWRPPGLEPTGFGYMTFEISYRHSFGNPF